MKIVEQINKSGNIVLDYDETLSVSEIKELLFTLFKPVIQQDGKQFLLYKKIALLVCNVTYLGNPHPIYKKRIQLKPYYLDYFKKNSMKNINTLYLGIYSYKKTHLFVVFEPSTYATKKSHNSSAHVYSINLQYAQRVGKFEKVDSFGNKIHIFNNDEFIKYIKLIAGEAISTEVDDVIKLINKYLSSFKNEIKKEWNGIECYKEMVESKDSNAKQGEWQGWYFEHLFKKFLEANHACDIEWYGSKKKTDIDLDVKFKNEKWIFGDLKADQINHDILGNSLECLDKVIKENHGTVYYICCLYKSEKDSEHGYAVTKYWNDNVRDEDKRYSNDDEVKNGYGRRMKFLVKPQQICVLKIDEVMYEILKKDPFNQGVNSDGKDRKPKLKVKKDMIKALTIFSEQIPQK